MRLTIITGLTALAFIGMAAQAADVPINVFDRNFARAFARLAGSATMQSAHCPVPGGCYQDIGWGVVLLTKAPGETAPVTTAILVSPNDHYRVTSRFTIAVEALVALLSPHIDDTERAASMKRMPSEFDKSGKACATLDDVLYELQSDPDQHILFRATPRSS